ncbi:MAG: rhodanese-like domain-containing protein [Epsilonproteobacteria bacterium]|nr:rhodanese-like domain-containing protein [Campylobacterota bacterium]
MNDMILYSSIGLIILYILYAKGIIFADFNFATPKEAMQMIKNEKKNIIILDVRTEIEYANDGHIKDAILIPVQNLQERLDELKKFKDYKILVYCASGNRSISASRILYANGFNPYNINGGISNWKRSGFKIQN